MKVVVAGSLHHEINEDGDETVELIESGALESESMKCCTLKPYSIVRMQKRFICTIQLHTLKNVQLQMLS